MDHNKDKGENEEALENAKGLIQVLRVSYLNPTLLGLFSCQKQPASNVEGRRTTGITLFMGLYLPRRFLQTSK